MSEGHSGLPGVVRGSLWLLGAFVLVMIGLVLYSILASRLITKTVLIGGVSHSVLIADNPTSRYLGLSDMPLERLDVEGMVFTFPTSEPRTFEMRGMLFSLDFVWVNQGTIVKIDRGVRAPVGDEVPATVSSSPNSVDTVFEFPTGFVANNGLFLGQQLIIK